MNTAVTDLIRVHVDIFVLKTLEGEDRYGLEILSAITEASSAKYEIKQPTLYNILKRLEKKGLIESYDGEESMGAKRRYYKLSEEGRQYLEDYKNEWVYTRTLLDNLISEEEIDLADYVPPFDASALRPLTRRNKADENEEEEEEEEKEEHSAFDKNEREEESLFITRPYLESSQPQNTEKPKAVSFDRENRDKASRLLAIGKYAPKPGYKITDPGIKNPAAKSKTTIYHKIFTESMERYHEKPKTVNIRPKAMHFNDLTVAYKNQGISLEGYNPMERLAFYKNNYIKINKIRLVASLLTFVILIAELVGCYFLNDYLDLPYWVLPAVAIVGFPYFHLIRYGLRPKARQLLNYNFYISALSALIIFLLLAGLSSILFIVTPKADISFTDPVFYAPWLVFSNIVIYQLIYRQLFVSKRFHCKSVV